jgi:hypothetical protein
MSTPTVQTSHGSEPPLSQRLSDAALLNESPGREDAMPFSVDILNDYANPLWTEVRTGNSPDCTQNALFFQGDLGAGQSVNPNNDDPVVCYRRSKNPDDPTEGPGGWNTFSPDDTNTPAQLLLSQAA